MGLLVKLKKLFKQEEKVIVENELGKEQDIINELYDENGLTDEVLDKQVALNKKRNELNIPDKTTLDKDGWSQ